jgi:DNA repair protein RadC
MLCAVKQAKMIIHEPQISYVKKNIPAVQINNPAELYSHLKEFCAKNIVDPTREHCMLTVVNNKGFVITTKILTIGTETSTLVSPKDVLRQVLLCGGTAFYISHTHPTSGDPAPSSADCSVTRKLREAASVLDIHFYDHLVLGEVENDPTGLGYYSFRSAGIL